MLRVTQINGETGNYNEDFYGGEAARLKREIQGGFLEEVVSEQDVSGWWMREACVSVSELSLVPLKFASSLWPHMPCFLLPICRPY